MDTFLSKYFGLSLFILFGSIIGAGILFLDYWCRYTFFRHILSKTLYLFTYKLNYVVLIKESKLCVFDFKVLTNLGSYDMKDFR